MAQLTISSAEFSNIHAALERGSLNLHSVMPEVATEWATVRRGNIIGSALGCSAARATQFCTLPTLSEIAGPGNIDFAVVLATLEYQLGQPFMTDYVSHIGSFEVFALEPWCGEGTPVSIEYERGADAFGPGGNWEAPGPLVIARERRFAQTKHIAHLLCRAGGDVIADRLIILEAGCERAYPLGAEFVDVDALEFRLFDAAGTHLIHQVQAPFVRSIAVTVSPGGRRIAIDDQLTATAKSSGATGAEAIGQVRAQSSERLMIEYPRPGWREHAAAARALLAETSPSPSQDRWFPKSIDGEVGVIRHFDTLLFGGRVRAAILVDPFFSPDALRRAVLRLSSQDVELTVVTSWATIEPDSGRPLPDGTASLERALARIAPFLNARLRVVNLVDGKDQAFHDRYLLLYMHEGPPIAYLLSNSLNKMAGRWPFCMSRLADDVRPAVQRYIEGLANGVDTTGSTSPRITFDWSPRAASEV